MPQSKLSDKDQLIAGYEKRIKFKKSQLLKTRRFHREVEQKIQKKINLDVLQLRALKKAK